MAATLLVTALVVIGSYMSTEEPAVVAQWRANLAAQQAAVDELKLINQTQTQTFGRQIATMQARIMRMEALGQRVMEVADLDDGDFSFGMPAAAGGPLQVTEGDESTQGLVSMEPEVDQMTQDLLRLEHQLEVMESLLRDKEYRQAKAPAGRPITWGWMSSPFGERLDPISGKKAWHAGVDFAGKKGSDVVAVAGGVVTFAGRRYGYGELGGDQPWRRLRDPLRPSREGRGRPWRCGEARAGYRTHGFFGSLDGSARALRGAQERTSRRSFEVRRR